MFEARPKKSTPVVQLALVFLVSFLTVGVTVAKSALAKLGYQTDYLLIALIALAVAGLMVHRRLLLVLMTVLLSAISNVPDLIQSLGLSRELLLSTLVALVVIPLVVRFFED